MKDMKILKKPIRIELEGIIDRVKVQIKPKWLSRFIKECRVIIITEPTEKISNSCPSYKKVMIITADKKGKEEISYGKMD